MPSEKHKPEETIGKLREVEIVLGQGGAVSEQTCNRWRKEGLKVPQRQPKRGRP